MNIIRLAEDQQGLKKLADLPWTGAWPPPEELEPFGPGWGKWRREIYSRLPEDLPNLARGAVYTFVEGSMD